MNNQEQVPKFLISHDLKFIYHTQTPKLLFSLYYDTAEMDERGGLNCLL
jgi:hypothetical protein